MFIRNCYSSKPLSCVNPKPSKRLGFTVVEMMIVVAVVLLILGIALPAAQTMWEQRKLINAQNLIQGMLLTARSKSIQAGDRETGLLFYVDQQGNQRIARIVQVDPSDLIVRGILLNTTYADYALTLGNVFEVVQEKGYTLSAPIRVTPRYVVNNVTTHPLAKPYDLFSNAELSNNDFYKLPGSSENNQRHRNFFTMIFSTVGHLVVHRNVLILDVDEDKNNVGDLTEMQVGYDHSSKSPNVSTYYDQKVNTFIIHDLAIENPVPFLVVADIDDPIAINFPSVDGVLVYDDALFNQAGSDAEKRALLIRTAQPLYVNRWTGGVITGPIGENETP